MMCPASATPMGPEGIKRPVKAFAGRNSGMGLVTAKLRESVARMIAMSVLVLNFRKIM